MNPLNLCRGMAFAMAISSSLPSGAQTLTTGDIAFSGYQSTSASDTFCFVVLRPQGIVSGTTINFTDNGWNVNNMGNTNEGIISWTASQNLSYGDQVSIWLGAGKGSPQGSVSLVSGTMSLAAAGDQIIAFQGTWNSSPTPLTGLHYNASAQTSTANWDGSNATVNNTTTSGYPSIPNGYGIWVKDPATSAATKTTNGYYHGLLYHDPTVMRSKVNDNLNWSYSSITSGDPGWRIPFSIQPANDNFISLNSLSKTGICSGSQLTAYFKVSGSFNSSNTFSLSLKSSANSAITILNGNANCCDSLQVTIPTTLAAETYLVTIKSSDPALEGSESISLEVYNPSTLTIQNTPKFCEGDNPVNLNFIQPSGGIYSGSSIQNNTINPAQLNPGQYAVSYRYVNQQGCESQLSSSITINPKPSIVFPDFGSHCKTDSTFVLSASPPGGSFTGVGVTQNSFYPANAISGHNEVFYTVTDVNSCTNTAKEIIVVHELPVVSFNLQSFICQGDSIPLSASPGGGNFQGQGVSGNSFKTRLLIPSDYLLSYSVTDSNGCSANSSATISINELPAVSFSLSDSICQDSVPFLLHGGTPSGGSYAGNYVQQEKFYSQQAGQGSFPITYSYTDAFGCNNRKTTNIFVKSASGTQNRDTLSFCEDSPAFDLVKGFPGLQHFSGQGVNGDVFFPQELTPGCYPISCNYSSNGCSGTTLVTLKVNPNPEPEIQGPQAGMICPQTSTQLSTIHNFVSYLWSFNNNQLSEESPTIQTTDSGWYVVKVTNNSGCSGQSQPFYLGNYAIQKPLPQWTEYPESCLHDTTQIWYPSSTRVDWFENNQLMGSAEMITITKTGSYHFSTIDCNGCNTASDPITISILLSPQINDNDSLTICSNDSVLLLPKWGQTTKWYFNDVEITSNSQTHIAQEAGIYKAMISNEYQCSVLSKSFQLNTNSIPYPEIELDGNDTLCSGESNRLKTQHYDAYKWYRNGHQIIGANTFELSNSKDGLISVWVSDTNGCSNRSGGTQVVVVKPREPEIDHEGAQFLCNGDSITLNCTNCNQQSFSWYRNDTILPELTQASFTTNQKGNYLIKITDWECEANSKAAVVIGLASPAKPEISFDGTQLHSDFSGNQQWFFENDEIPGAGSSDLEVQNNGEYSVKVFGNNGCSTLSDPYFVRGLSISAIKSKEFVLFPNPTLGLVNLHTTSPGICQVYGSKGEHLLQQTLKMGKNELIFSVLPSGIYLLKILLDNGSNETISVVKE